MKMLFVNHVFIPQCFRWVQCGFEGLAKEKLVFENIREFSRESFDYGESFPVKTGRYSNTGNGETTLGKT